MRKCGRESCQRFPPSQCRSRSNRGESCQPSPPSLWGVSDSWGRSHLPYSAVAGATEEEEPSLVTSPTLQYLEQQGGIRLASEDQKSKTGPDQTAFALLSGAVAAPGHVWLLIAKDLN